MARFGFRLIACSACQRTKLIPGKKKRCYDCYMNGYTKRTKDIPYRVKNN